MKNKYIIISSILILSIFIIIPMLITFFTHNYYFNKRIVHENQYFEFLSTQNPNFNREPASFTSNEGQILSGAFYFQEENTNPDALLIFVHGMGVNHDNYLAEIEMLTKENYLVFSYNNTGVDTSGGDSLKGLIQAPIDLQHALTYIYDLDKYNDIPNILIGHSWGGFSVATVSQLEIPRPVDGIITLAGFWKNINVIEDIATYYVGDLIKPLVPYLSLYEYMIFGEDSSLNGVDGLLATNCPVLMIHSEDDTVVSYNSNFLHFMKTFENDERFTFKSYIDAGHKLTINRDSYNRIHDIMHHQMDLDINSDKYKEYDLERLSLITDFNFDVMNEIINFCDKISK